MAEGQRPSPSRGPDLITARGGSPPRPASDRMLSPRPGASRFAGSPGSARRVCSARGSARGAELACDGEPICSRGVGGGTGRDGAGGATRVCSRGAGSLRIGSRAPDGIDVVNRVGAAGRARSAELAPNAGRASAVVATRGTLTMRAGGTFATCACLTASARGPRAFARGASGRVAITVRETTGSGGRIAAPLAATELAGAGVTRSAPRIGWS
jgi:hypothetical protein